jgi:hypothetical protein
VNQADFEQVEAAQALPWSADNLYRGLTPLWASVATVMPSPEIHRLLSEDGWTPDLLKLAISYAQHAIAHEVTDRVTGVVLPDLGDVLTGLVRVAHWHIDDVGRSLPSAVRWLALLVTTTGPDRWCEGENVVASLTVPLRTVDWQQVPEMVDVWAYAAGLTVEDALATGLTPGSDLDALRTLAVLHGSRLSHVALPAAWAPLPGND